VLERLAESYPSPRQKQEVPVWFYLASQISLRLHGPPGYNAFPYVIRCGGLIDALGPEVGRKAVHPQTGDVSLGCSGFNDKNRYDRQTPCDQDFLRKFARDTDAQRLQEWFNRELPRLKDFHWEALVLPTATPPEQPDRAKDPVIAQRERKRQRKLQARQARSHAQPLPPAQTLLGIGRGVSSWADCPVPLTALINRKINAQGEVHDGVVATTAPRWSAQLTRTTYKLRTAIAERHRQYKCFWDIAWMTACKFALVLSQVLFVLLAYTLFQGHLFLRHRPQMNRPTRPRILQRLAPTPQVVAVYDRQRFGLLLLPEFAEILLELAEDARAKLLRKMRLLKRDLYQLLENAPSP
jgi:hypothetical protein